MGPIRNYVIEYYFAANKDATGPKITSGYVEVITSKLLMSPHKLGYPLWNIYVINDHGYVPLVAITIRSFWHSCLITELVTRVTLPVPLVEKELPTLPEHLCSPPICTCLSWVRVVKLHVFAFLVPCCNFR